MTWTPQLNVVCGRCGKPRGLLRHDCFSNSRRKATIVPELSFGKCPKCKKPVGNPLTHTCHPRSDFKRRKARAARQAEKHDYQACSDKDCPRPLCVAYKTGDKAGYERGYDDGFGAGFGAGFAAGAASTSGSGGSAS